MPDTPTNFDDVGHFHEKFGLDNVTHRPVGPRRVPVELVQFRTRFLDEELAEFKAAIENHDPVEAFDALLDLVYVAMGTAHLLGFPWQEGWDEVHRTNMAKVRARSAAESKRGASFDVVKPEGWTAPDLAGILARYPRVEA